MTSHSAAVLSAPIPQSAPAEAVALSTDDRHLPHQRDMENYEPRGVGEKIATMAAVTLPFAALGVSIYLLWGVAFSWVYLALLVGMYVLTAIGITIGYHRLFTHRAFAAPKPVVAVLAILGSMAAEGSVLDWVAYHRRHHQHSDSADDPHSPHLHGEGAWAVFKGFWHAHMGWFFSQNPKGLDRYVGDLKTDPVIRFVSKTFFLWVAVGLLIPAVIGGLVTQSWMGVLLGMLWGGGVRLFLVHHVTWSINSVCHLWGSRPFKSQDESRNNAVFGILGLGEGWHNNHHAFPTSARHGLRWWEIDVSYWLIVAMSWVGLARQIRVPSAERMAEKRRRSGR